MVYRGPSKGCKTCRKRRVKCDQRRPNCGNCAKQARLCPGYDDLFIHCHRDETAKTAKRSGSSMTFHKTMATKVSTSFAGLGGVPILLAQSTVLSLPTLLPDAQSVALNFFFLGYGISHDKESSCSIFSLLPATYGACTSSSPLGLAIAALAVNVTSLWRLRGSDTAPARDLYAQAVTGVKLALSDATKSLSDELLMAVLVLEAYDNVNGEYQSNASPGVHASGSMALLGHRAALNYRNELSRDMVVAIRNNYVWDAITERRHVHNFDSVWQDHGIMSHGLAAKVDRLAFELFQLRNLLCQLGHPSPHQQQKENGSNYTSVLSRAVVLREECSKWIQELPYRWRPMPVHRDEVNQSVKAAGMYGTTCDVYANISIANTRNWHRIIEFGTLQVLSTCLQVSAQRPSSNVHSGELQNIMPQIQLIVDEICASVPYCVGDITKPTSPVLGDIVRFPFVHLDLPGISGPRTFPEFIAQHEVQVASSGAKLMHRVLTSTANMIEGDYVHTTLVCNHKREWIKSQISRLSSVLHPKLKLRDT